MNRRILVIEDNADIGRLLELHLAAINCDVRWVADGIAGLEEAQRSQYDLVVLDLMLPGLDGLEICRRLRAKSVYTPIMMVTAKVTEFDRVLGLELGADDYLTKPFSVLELTARVKALFRRMDAFAEGEAAPDERPLRCGELFIDSVKREVTLAGRPVNLTAKEFDLLLHFARNRGRVYSRLQLLDAVWGYGHDGYEHNVNCHINRLRAKIETDPASPRFVLTVRGVGYRLGDSRPSPDQ